MSHSSTREMDALSQFMSCIRSREREKWVQIMTHGTNQNHILRRQRTLWKRLWRMHQTEDFLKADCIKNSLEEVVKESSEEYTCLSHILQGHKYVTHLVLHKSHNALLIGRVTAHALWEVQLYFRSQLQGLTIQCEPCTKFHSTKCLLIGLPFLWWPTDYLSSQ